MSRGRSQLPIARILVEAHPSRSCSNWWLTRNKCFRTWLSKIVVRYRLVVLANVLVYKVVRRRVALQRQLEVPAAQISAKIEACSSSSASETEERTRHVSFGQNESCSLFGGLPIT